MNSLLLHNTFERVCKYLRSFDTIVERYFVANNKIMVARTEYGHKLLGTYPSSSMNYSFFYGTTSSIEDQLKCFLLSYNLEFLYRGQKTYVWHGSVIDHLSFFSPNIHQQLLNSIGQPESLEEWNIKLDLIGA